MYNVFFTKICIISPKSKFSPTYLPYRLRSDFLKNEYREIHRIIFNCNFEAFVKIPKWQLGSIHSWGVFRPIHTYPVFITLFWTTEFTVPSNSLNIVCWKKNLFFQYLDQKWCFLQFLYRVRPVINVKESKGQRQLRIDPNQTTDWQIFFSDHQGHPERAAAIGK